MNLIRRKARLARRRFEGGEHRPGAATIQVGRARRARHDIGDRQHAAHLIVEVQARLRRVLQHRGERGFGPVHAQREPAFAIQRDGFAGVELSGWLDRMARDRQHGLRAHVRR